VNLPRARLSILPDFVITQRLEGRSRSEKSGEMRHARSLYFCNYKESRKTQRAYSKTGSNQATVQCWFLF